MIEAPLHQFDPELKDWESMQWSACHSWVTHFSNDLLSLYMERHKTMVGKWHSCDVLSRMTVVHNMKKRWWLNLFWINRAEARDHFQWAPSWLYITMSGFSVISLRANLKTVSLTVICLLATLSDGEAYRLTARGFNSKHAAARGIYNFTNHIMRKLVSWLIIYRPAGKLCNCLGTSQES